MSDFFDLVNPNSFGLDLDPLIPWDGPPDLLAPPSLVDHSLTQFDSLIPDADAAPTVPELIIPDPPDLPQGTSLWAETMWDQLEPQSPADARVESYRPGMLVPSAGDASRDDDFWHYQGEERACAVVVQGSIIEAITGIPFDQGETTAWLRAQGWYDPSSGTSRADLTRLLDAYGIGHVDGPATVPEMFDALQRGDRVMVTVDAAEIWYPEDDPVTGKPVEIPGSKGHAVWVTEIGLDPLDQQWKVVLNDSGHPDGRASVVELDDFMQATDDYQDFTVIVDSHSHDGRPARVAGLRTP